MDERRGVAHVVERAIAGGEDCLDAFVALEAEAARLGRTRDELLERFSPDVWTRARMALADHPASPVLDADGALGLVEFRESRTARVDPDALDAEWRAVFEQHRRAIQRVLETRIEVLVRAHASRRAIDWEWFAASYLGELGLHVAERALFFGHALGGGEPWVFRVNAEGALEDVHRDPAPRPAHVTVAEPSLAPSVDWGAWAAALAEDEIVPFVPSLGGS